MKYSTAIVAGLLSLVSAHQAGAISAPLALRYEPNAVYVHNGVTSQTIENSFGTNLLGLAFTGTNTYDFYSPPLATALDFDNNDKAGGTIVMSNSAPTSDNDFSVDATMLFYDYNPLTGVDTLLVQTTQAAAVSQKVSHGKTARWIMKQNSSHTNFTLPAGHLLHIAVTLVLDSGNPGSFGQLLYNGPREASTSAFFPRNSALPLGGRSPSVTPTPLSITSVTLTPDGCAQLNCTCGSTGYYLIQATTNLANPSSWVTISTNMADTNGCFQCTDTDAPNHSSRFYRLVTP